MSYRNLTTELRRARVLESNIVKHYGPSGRYTARTFKINFNVQDLNVNRVLTVNHNMDLVHKAVVVSVYDNNSQLVLTRPKCIDGNSVEINFGNIPVNGTWSLIIVG